MVDDDVVENWGVLGGARGGGGVEAGLMGAGVQPTTVRGACAAGRTGGIGMG